MFGVFKLLFVPLIINIVSGSYLLDLVGKNKVNGIVYSPYRHDGGCPTYAHVLKDLTVLSKVTKSIHLYGMDCDQVELVLSVYKTLKLETKNISLMLGMWIRGKGQFENEYSKLKTTLQNHESYLKNNNILSSICVGNEELFTNAMKEDELIDKLNVVKSLTKYYGYDNVKVFTTDVPKLWTQNLVDNSDLIGLNLHPYFDQSTQVSYQQTVEKVFDQVKDLKLKFGAYNKPLIVAETGWPSQTNLILKDTGDASLKFQFSFLNSFICRSKYLNLDYYLFEAFDSVWKQYNKFGDVERHFGIFDKDRNLKFNFNLLSC